MSELGNTESQEGLVDAMGSVELGEEIEGANALGAADDLADVANDSDDLAEQAPTGEGEAKDSDDEATERSSKGTGEVFENALRENIGGLICWFTFWRLALISRSCSATKGKNAYYYAHAKSSIGPK